MELWTQYEGIKIDGAFPLTRLLRPEGRSAFFTTSNEAGLARLIRLVESRSDEDDILSRWRGVAALDHPNILKLEEYGQVVVDETSLVYAVMEPIDANLGEVVRDQRLSFQEARQIALSLVSALDALHSHGFIHKHVQPINIVAIGEVVKLQCDCISEAPEGEPGQLLKQRDVHDLAVVLLQALTQEQTLEAASGNLPLPAPFDQIVTRALKGEWGLTQIAAALKGTPTSHAATIAAVSPETRTAGGSRSSSPESAHAIQPSLFEMPSTPDPDPVSAAREVPARREAVKKEGLPLAIGPIAAFAAGLIVLIIAAVAWYLHSRRPTVQANPPSATLAVDSSAKTAATATASSVVESPTAVAPVAASVRPDKTAAAPAQWRVIVYTFRQEALANKKAARLAQERPELKPAVFRPKGEGPYLVTVGGAMEKDEAYALAKRVRHQGLPHDAYAQNYRGSDR